ncbi:hypothetical protein QR680_004514 [Steinernema hermaphroditum]|uniref:NNMT/PNMT/TEMT family protein n=1 Tax=Steinernema hermaphroditum TaxID=289476 RepID=A0AA39HR51_9BILA|nr:hypothetical protein QR680_004514 [Steinernema hermaphroditum]
MSELIRCLDGRRVLDRDAFHDEFSTEDYLKDFYMRVEDQAMQFVLNFLPNLVARIGKVDRVLDFGAGPTIHVAVSFRNSAKEIYLADYLPQNRNELLKWHNKSSVFEWDTTLRILAKCEGQIYSELSVMEQAARDKVKGIFHCDCFKDPSVDAPSNLLGTFNVIVTIFCVEYCCKTQAEYKQCIANIAKQIAPGGHFIMGGILEETWCSFGGRLFTCLYITQEFMFECLREAGLDIDDPKASIFYEVNGMFLVCAKKKN